jgi:hypothetical protein
MALLVHVKISQICVSWSRFGEAGAAVKSERSKLLTFLSLDPSILHPQHTGRPNSATQSNKTSIYLPPTYPALPSLSILTTRSPRPVKQGSQSAYLSSYGGSSYPNPPPRRPSLASHQSYSSQNGFSKMSKERIPPIAAATSISPSALPGQPISAHTPPKPNQIACITCRKRKLKCDRSKPICSTCARLGRNCVYDEVRRKSGPKRGYANSLEERLGEKLLIIPRIYQNLRL